MSVTHVRGFDERLAACFSGGDTTVSPSVETPRFLPSVSFCVKFVVLTFRWKLCWPSRKVFTAPSRSLRVQPSKPPRDEFSVGEMRKLSHFHGCLLLRMLLAMLLLETKRPCYLYA